jgi:hypothetical protein
MQAIQGTNAMTDKCKNQVFTTEGAKTCGDKGESGNTYHCYNCLEQATNNAIEVVEVMATALYLVKQEYLDKGELSQDTLRGITDHLNAVGFASPEQVKKDRPVYPH